MADTSRGGLAAQLDGGASQHPGICWRLQETAGSPQQRRQIWGAELVFSADSTGPLSEFTQVSLLVANSAVLPPVSGLTRPAAKDW